MYEHVESLSEFSFVWVVTGHKRLPTGNKGALSTSTVYHCPY